MQQHQNYYYHYLVIVITSLLFCKGTCYHLLAIPDVKTVNNNNNKTSKNYEQHNNIIQYAALDYNWINHIGQSSLAPRAPIIEKTHLLTPDANTHYHQVASHAG